MTTTDSSFVAEGALSGLGGRSSYPIGFYANSKSPRVGPAGPLGRPFQVGTLAVGQTAGVYGATDDVVLPRALGSLPGASNFGNAGVWGYSGSSPGSSGVAGYSDSTGVSGRSISGWGVWAWSWSGWGLSAYSWDGFAVHAESVTNSGVVGLVGGSSSGWFHFPIIAGVVGIAQDRGPALSQAPQQGNTIDPPMAGVLGTADKHPGVIGTSNDSIGVYGFSTGNSGVMGESVTSWAGYFAGNLMVTGQIFAGVKDAIVPFPDGSKRVLHCMESPEHWFEDFGAGTLKRGRAVVNIDRDFAKVIKRGDYHVFLTPRGDCRGLYVRRQGGTSFEVRELAGGTSSAAFSYRIVGRRKDVKGHRRFAKIDTRLPVPPARRGRRGRVAKVPPPPPAELRAFAARMRKAAQGHMRKRGRKGKGS